VFGRSRGESDKWSGALLDLGRQIKENRTKENGDSSISDGGGGRGKTLPCSMKATSQIGK